MFLSSSRRDKIDDNSDLKLNRAFDALVDRIVSQYLTVRFAKIVPVAGCVFTRETIEFCQQIFTTRHTAEYLAAAT